MATWKVMTSLLGRIMKDTCIYIYICRYTGQLKMVTFLRLFCMQKEVKKVAVLFVVSGAAM